MKISNNFSYFGKTFRMLNFCEYFLKNEIFDQFLKFLKNKLNNIVTSQVINIILSQLNLLLLMMVFQGHFYDYISYSEVAKFKPFKM
mgnify:CR=1 FL=1